MYVVTLDNYVRTFKQSTLYPHFKKGGRLGQGPNEIELLLHRVTQSRDLKQFEDEVLKYFSKSICIIRIAHMEGKIFGSCKWKVNLAPIKRGFT